MFTKSSSYYFQKYGDTYLSLPKDCDDATVDQFTIDNKTFDTLFFAENDIFLHVDDGIAMMYISYENDAGTFEQFVVHHTIRIKKNCYFNFISISESALITIHSKIPNSLTNVALNGIPIVYSQILPKLTIKEILVYYYQVKSSNYAFNGEVHDFWELTYVDNGNLITEIDGVEYFLKANDVILYAPGQFHTQKMDGVEACSYLTVIFKMDFATPSLLSDQIFHSSRNIVNTLQKFIQYSDRSDEASKQLCISFLNQAIIQLLQSNSVKAAKIANSPIQQKFEDQFLNEIIMYINYNYFQPLTVAHLCQKFSISRSFLQQLFNKNLGMAPKQYIAQVKLKKAKFLIKENKYTISEISEKLGFTSIHYFSRAFKKEFNLSPSEYAKSIYKV